MNNRTFFLGLLLVAGVLAALLGWSSTHPKLSDFASLGWISWGAFLLLTVMMFFQARKAANSENRNTFTTVLMGFTLLKLLLVMAFLLGYYFLFEPLSKGFAVPVLLVYLGFTAFELYFMLKLSRIKL